MSQNNTSVNEVSETKNEKTDGRFCGTACYAVNGTPLGAVHGTVYSDEGDPDRYCHRCGLVHED